MVVLYAVHLPARISEQGGICTHERPRRFLVSRRRSTCLLAQDAAPLRSFLSSQPPRAACSVGDLIAGQRARSVSGSGDETSGSRLLTKKCCTFCSVGCHPVQICQPAVEQRGRRRMRPLRDCAERGDANRLFFMRRALNDSSNPVKKNVFSSSQTRFFSKKGGS